MLPILTAHPSQVTHCRNHPRPSCRRVWIAFLLGLCAVSLAKAESTRLVIKGSDTLGAKLVPQLAEAFRAEGLANITFEIAAEGSSTGVAAILDGTAQIGMSSRDLERSEYAKARLRGIHLKAIPIAFDAVAIIANAANPIRDLSGSEVEGLFTGGIANWAALGGYPGRVSVYTRNSASGTYRAFKDLAMRRQDYGPLTQKLAGNEQIASEVSGNPYGIGYVGLAYVATNGVKILPVNSVMPNEIHIREGSYPYARPLYFLINEASSSEVRDRFIAFALGTVGQWIVRQVDFIPVNPPEAQRLPILEVSGQKNSIPGAEP